MDMELRKRDKLIITALVNQDYCFYNDIARKFFPSSSSASHSLKRLVKAGYVCVEPVGSIKNKKTLDDLSFNFLKNNKKVLFLGERYKILRRKVSSWKKTHQLLLFSVRERLEKLLNEKAFFENHIKDLKETLYNGKHDPIPDLYFKGKGFKLAIELELNIKSKRRYFLKMSHYKNSSYSHVLYITAHGKKMDKLIRNFSYGKYIAISHYMSFENEIFNKSYGRMSLFDFLKKRVK